MSFNFYSYHSDQRIFGGFQVVSDACVRVTLRQPNGHFVGRSMKVDILNGVDLQKRFLQTSIFKTM